MPTPAEIEAYWRERYARLRTTDDGRDRLWLDYSSDEQRGLKQQTQTFGFILDALGPVTGLRCLDAGCGWGRFTLVLSALGANPVGLDLMDDTVEALRREYPAVQWAAGSFLDGAVLAALGTFDRVVAVESFQCAGPPVDSLQALWQAVAPGGRLVVSLPNADDAIVQRATSTLDGKLFSITPQALREATAALPRVQRFALRGLYFSEDQWIAPYEATPWSSSELAWPRANRLMVVAEKSSE